MGIRLHVIMIMQLHNHIRSSGWGNEWNISTLHNIRLNMWSRDNGMRNQSSDWWANIQIQLTVLIYLVAEGVKIKQVWYVCLCFLLQHRVLTFTLAGIWYWMYEIEKKNSFILCAIYGMIVEKLCFDCLCSCWFWYFWIPFVDIATQSNQKQTYCSYVT